MKDECHGQLDWVISHRQREICTFWSHFSRSNSTYIIWYAYSHIAHPEPVDDPLSLMYTIHVRSTLVYVLTVSGVQWTHSLTSSQMNFHFMWILILISLFWVVEDRDTRGKYSTRESIAEWRMAVAGSHLSRQLIFCFGWLENIISFALDSTNQNSN